MQQEQEHIEEKYPILYQMNIFLFSSTSYLNVPIFTVPYWVLPLLKN